MTIIILFITYNRSIVSIVFRWIQFLGKLSFSSANYQLIIFTYIFSINHNIAPEAHRINRTLSQCFISWEHALTCTTQQAHYPGFQESRLWPLQDSAGEYSRITSTKLRRNAPQQREVRQKWQEACMDEWGAPGQTQTQKESLYRVEARTESGRSTAVLSKQPEIRLGKMKQWY